MEGFYINIINVDLRHLKKKHHTPVEVLRWHFEYYSHVGDKRAVRDYEAAIEVLQLAGFE